MKTLMEDMDGNIRLHLRMIIWKQWKTIKKRVVGLRKLGMSKNWAWAYANTRKGYYVTGLWLSRWIRIKYLKAKGLLSMADHYHSKHHTIQLQLSVL